MRIYVLLFLLATLMQSCSNSGTNQTTKNAVSSEDSLQIMNAFVPPFINADSIYNSLQTDFSKKAATIDFLNLNYGKVLIMSGRLDKADTLITSAITRTGFDTTSLAHARYANLQAAIEAYKQNQEGAIGYYKKAIQLFEKHNDTKSAASINFNIANIFLSRLNYPMAYQYSAEAVKGFKAANDTLYYPSALAVNAVSAIVLGKKEEAKTTAEQAREISERYKNALGIVMSSYALAEIAMYDKKYDTAIAQFQKVIPLAQQLQQITVTSAAYTSLVKAYLESENYDLAITEGKKAIEFSKKFGYEDVSYSLNRYISQAYQQKGDEHSALQYMRMADEHFRDELVSNDRRVMGELLVQYQTEKKERQIAEQTLEIQNHRSNFLYAIFGGVLLVLVLGGFFIYNRKAQKLKLKRLQQEKENAILNSFILGEERERKRISQDLHDGVAAMIGAAKMSLDAIPHLPEDKRLEQLSKVKGILENTHADVRHIAHNLLPTVLEVEGLIKATTHFAFEINQTKLIDISVKDYNSNAKDLSTQLQLMLFRVIQELVNNIVKHSQAQKAEIIFSNSPNGLQIEITDDGIGYEGINNSGNQGLYSITQRLKSIGGNFKITKGSSGGTQAKVEIVV
ncbi:MAG TPA: histidine kinase [Chitinophagales bacterium]|nr:hypothetical protein [Chitinophagales bacterium]HND96453.1 histidine kinase [Chitinophagaceae bacterium]HMU98818.1 histidine kinase [Chitinophagales bacterium]HMW95034.1 histidine kinase [Chitinophagales bacterium]HMY43114.1 histidine kinase [Chitinophagales bacterium]